MKKYLPVYAYGILILVSGVFLLLSKTTSYDTFQFRLGFSLSLASLFAFFAAFSRQKKQVQFAYHELHALAMLGYGVSILFFCHSFEEIKYFSSFLFIFYAFSEIIFCNWLFNLGRKVLYSIVIVRFLLGLLIGIGTVVAMYQTEHTLQIFGVLFLMVGVNVMLYVPVMKKVQVEEASTQLPV